MYDCCGWAGEEALGGCATDDAEAAWSLDKDDDADADADEEADAVPDTGADTVADADAGGVVTGAPGAGLPPCVRCAPLVAFAPLTAAWSTPCSMPGTIGIGPGMGGSSRGVDCFEGGCEEEDDESGACGGGGAAAAEECGREEGG